MKGKKLLVSILLSMLAVCTVLSGCSKDTPDATDTGSGTNAGSETQAPAPEYQYTVNTPGVVDLSEYTIVRAEDASQAIIKATSQLRGYLNSYCGLNIQVKTDDKDVKGKEILIGQTNRAASLAVYKNVKEKNWSVSVADGNIVLASGVDSTINLATTWIQNNCLEQGNKYALIGEGTAFQYNYPITALTVGETEISDMTVAYLAADNVGYVDAAYMLAYDILDRFGEPVEVVEYNPANASTHILVASYEQAQKYLPENAPAIGNNEYAVINNNGGIMILADDAVGAELGVQMLINTCKTSTDGKADFATVCSNEKKTVSFGTDTLALMDGAEYRIMSFNIWRFQYDGGVTGDNYGIDQKSARLAAAKNTLLYYSPDVVGFQEYCPEWTADYTTWMTQNGYTVVGNEKVEEEDNDETFYTESQNYTPIAFKTDKFELIASGWQRMAGTYEAGAEGDLGYYPGHNITWVVLKDKTTNEQFAVTSTHVFHGGGMTAAEGAAKRNENAAEIVTLANKLKTDYSCQVICVGDYNSNEKSDAYKTLTANTSNLKDARYVATKEYAATGGYHAWGDVAVTDGTESAIDHAFVTEGVGVIRHKLALNQMTADAADHFPMFIDITID